MLVELSLKVRVVPKHVSMTSQDQAYFGIVVRASEVLLPKTDKSQQKNTTSSRFSFN